MRRWSQYVIMFCHVTENDLWFIERNRYKCYNRKLRGLVLVPNKDISIAKYLK